MSSEDRIRVSDGLTLPPVHQTLIDDPGDPALLEQGWLKRFVTDETRLEELEELYLELGFEVHVEPLKTQQSITACSDCALYAACNYLTIYVRKT